jgi:uncharacterized membrane protein
MATATRPRKSSQRQSKGGSSAGRASRSPASTKARGKPARQAATRVAEKTTDVVTPSGGSSGVSALARRAAAQALKKVATRVADSGAAVVRAAAERTAEEGRERLLQSMTPRLPIQRAVDVAVPLQVAWDEWMSFDSLPEGVDRVEEIEREGNELIGRTVGVRRAPWRAEILDERERASFAWQSLEGSDCAGLVTFHELSARLTRIELNLDVVPTSAAEAVSLATHLAHRRAEIELRRLKARLELINPDLYDDVLKTEGDEDSDDKPRSRR